VSRSASAAVRTLLSSRCLVRSARRWGGTKWRGIVLRGTFWRVLLQGCRGHVCSPQRHGVCAASVRLTSVCESEPGGALRSRRQRDSQPELSLGRSKCTQHAVTSPQPAHTLQHAVDVLLGWARPVKMPPASLTTAGLQRSASRRAAGPAQVTVATNDEPGLESGGLGTVGEQGKQGSELAHRLNLKTKAVGERAGGRAAGRRGGSGAAAEAPTAAIDAGSVHQAYSVCPWLASQNPSRRTRVGTCTSTSLAGSCPTG
jgi:hypothetical protein